MKSLTKRQLEILSYLQDFIQIHRYSPSYREIMQHFGMSSVGSVYKHIQVLKQKGAIALEPKGKRSLVPANEITTPYKNKNCQIELPLLGYITLGYPIETFVQTQTISIPEYMVKDPDKTYVLKAKDDSLNDEMVMQGDHLLVEARSEAHVGETVLALLNHHDTVIKKYFPEESYIRLVSHNLHHQTLVVRPQDMIVQGIMVGMVRNY